jgi:hypothetical protein
VFNAAFVGSPACPSHVVCKTMTADRGGILSDLDKRCSSGLVAQNNKIGP